MQPNLNDWIFPDAIDGTMCKSFKACPQQFFHKYVNGLHVPADETSVHLVAGKALAAALEEARNRFYVLGSCSTDAVEYGLEKLIEVYGPDRPQEAKNLSRMSEAYRAYFKKWPLSFSSGIVPIEAGVENTFSFPLPILHPTTGKPLVYAGKRDMIGREMGVDDPFSNEAEGELWGVDEKTCKYINDGWQHIYDLDWQFLGYTYYERMIEGHEIEGVIIRRIGLARAKFTPSSDLKDAKIRYSDELMVDWYEEMLETVMLMTECFKASKIYNEDRSYKAFSEACNAFTGCDFKSLCTHAKVTPDYQIVRWNPLKREMEDDS